MKPLCLLVFPVLLAACATSKPARSPAGTEASDAPSKTESQITDIATTPLNDFNLVRVKIPPILQTARTKPYATPKDPGCAGLAQEVLELDAALGADLDVPPNPEDPGMVERSAVFIGDAAVGAARGAAQDIVPFRSWVRKLTGAERHAKEVAAAIAAGIVRRAYLKGLGQSAGCEAPAAPRK